MTTAELTQKHTQSSNPVGARYKLTIEIKDIDRENETPESVVKSSHLIAARIRSQVPAFNFDPNHPSYNFDFSDVIKCMESCTIESLEEDENNGSSAVDMFNGWMNSVYDWADRSNVWIEI